MAVAENLKHDLPDAFDGGTELLEAYDPSDFNAADRLIAIFARQSHTIAGFPRVRPADCARITGEIEGILFNNIDLFKMGDPLIARKFDDVIAAFAQTEVRAYVGEYQRVLILWTRMKLLRSDIEGALAIVEPLASRPYAIETDFFGMMDVLALDLQCKSLLGAVEECSRLAMQRIRMLIRIRPDHAWIVGRRFANFISLQSGAGRSQGLIEAISRFWAGAVSRSRRNKGVNFVLDPLWKRKPPTSISLADKIANAESDVYDFFLGLNLAILRYGDIPIGFGRGACKRSGEIIVTRAMGGIGDLLMMTPGLRALSKRYSQKIKMVVPAKYFSIFENLPFVELVDMDGAAVDVANASKWFNLSVCPATAYEAPNRPFARKGRVELFAGGMGIPLKLLNRTGQRIQINLRLEEQAFCEEFRIANDFGKRPLVGIQPFSREEYRNYPPVAELMRELTRHYDVLVFHHRADGLPSGARIFSTAGCSVRNSFALVSILDALVTVDSSFMHAASAFDVPVVALFGPIDGEVRTRHLERVKVVSLKDQFPCSPCWRNEDEVCHVTQHVGVSPCMAAIPRHLIVEAVGSFIGSSSGRRIGQ